MALGFQRQGIFGRKPMFPQDDVLSNGPFGTPGIGDDFNRRMFGGQEMQPVNSQPNQMPIGVKEITKKPGFFGKDSALWKVLGTLGDAFSDGPPIYTQSILQQRDAEERARMAQQQRMQKREDMLWEWKNKPKDDSPKDQLTRYMIAAGIDPNSEEARGMYRAAAQNAAYPVQGVPFTDEQGNSGIQFIRPGQMQGAQQGLIPIGGTLPPKGGSVGNGAGGFR